MSLAPTPRRPRGRRSIQFERVPKPAGGVRTIARLDPFDADAHAMLGRFALQRNEAESAAREFRSVIALGPVDRAAAYTDLAESYFKGGKRTEARKYILAALEIAPNYERAQDLLLKIVGGGDK